MLVAAPLAAADADDRQLAGTPVQARSAQSVSTVSLGGAVAPIPPPSSYAYAQYDRQDDHLVPSSSGATS